MTLQLSDPTATPKIPTWIDEVEASDATFGIATWRFLFFRIKDQPSKPKPEYRSNSSTCSNLLGKGFRLGCGPSRFLMETWNGLRIHASTFLGVSGL